jgi:ribosomal protein S18 acetylase RimI-like enzyme
VSALVRDARSEDVRELAPELAALPLLTRYGTSAERLAADLDAALGRGEGLIVVEEAGRTAGLAWFLPTGTFALGGYLRLIALRAGTEGQGLGAALLDEVERRVAARSRSLFLLCSHWNQAARRFYAGRGYHEVGVLPGFVRADTDEVICMKRLA